MPQNHLKTQTLKSGVPAESPLETLPSLILVPELESQLLSFQIQLPANVSWKAADDGPRAQSPAHLGGKRSSGFLALAWSCAVVDNGEPASRWTISAGVSFK